MRFIFIAATIAMVATAAFGQIVIEDWEGTWENAAGEFQTPSYSGSTSGITADAVTEELTIVAPGSTVSCRWEVTWTGASGGQVRWTTFPTRPLLAGGADFSLTPILRLYIYADANSNGLDYQWCPRDTGYERTDAVTIDWSGWSLETVDCSTANFTGWITGDGTLTMNAATDLEAIFIHQGTIGAVTSVLYFDELVASDTVPVELSLFSTE